MVRFCPIVYLPETMTASELRRTRPFLWLSIMACGTLSMVEANAIGDRVRKIIAHRVVIELDRSLDLLQGMLVFMQWPHSHKTDRPWLSLWTNIGVSMAEDMGFTSLKGETAFTYVKKFWMPKHNCPSHLSTARTTEEYRTILATYVWTST